MDEAFIHDHLDLLLQLRRACQREGSSGRSVQTFLRHSLMFVRDLMTDDIFQRAMKTGRNGEGLLLLANRIQLLEPLLGTNWPGDFDFTDLVNDVFGIAHGDAPRILKSSGRRGQFRNAHALLEKKLDAHGWYKLLGCLEIKAPERQALIIESYGVTFDAFGKWRQEAKAKLSSDYVERYLVSFLEAEMLSAKLVPDSAQWAMLQARNAGAEYKRELKSISYLSPAGGDRAN